MTLNKDGYGFDALFNFGNSLWSPKKFLIKNSLFASSIFFSYKLLASYLKLDSDSDPSLDYFLTFEPFWISTLYFVNSQISFPNRFRFKRLIKKRFNKKISIKSHVGSKIEAALLSVYLIQQTDFFKFLDQKLVLWRSFYEQGSFEKFFTTIDQTDYKLLVIAGLFTNMYSIFKTNFKRLNSSFRRKNSLSTFFTQGNLQQKLTYLFENGESVSPLLNDLKSFDRKKFYEIFFKKYVSNKNDSFKLTSVRDFTKQIYRSIYENNYKGLFFDLLSQSRTNIRNLLLDEAYKRILPLKDFDIEDKVLVAWYSYDSNKSDYKDLWKDIFRETIDMNDLKKYREASNQIYQLNKIGSLTNAILLLKFSNSNSVDKLEEEFLLGEVAERISRKHNYLSVPMIEFVKGEDNFISMIHPQAKTLFEEIPTLSDKNLEKVIDDSLNMRLNFVDGFKEQDLVSLNVVDLEEKLLKNPLIDDVDYASVVRDRISLIDYIGSELEPGLDFHTENILFLKTFNDNYILGKIDHANKGLLPAMFDYVNLVHYNFDKLDFDQMLSLVKRSIDHYKQEYSLDHDLVVKLHLASLAYRRDSYISNWKSHSQRVGRIIPFLDYSSQMIKILKADLKDDDLFSWELKLAEKIKDNLETIIVK